jgi:SAM-dependent methyltransferase
VPVGVVATSLLDEGGESCFPGRGLRSLQAYAGAGALRGVIASERQGDDDGGRGEATSSPIRPGTVSIQRPMGDSFVRGEDLRVVDRIFGEPRLAALYDFVDDDRSDLDVYEALVDELGAESVLDVGCGTGNLACRLALGGTQVVGLDPAAASLDVARGKPGGKLVRWVHGEVADLPELNVDLVTMTGNVAQVFLSDREWAQVLAAAHQALRPGGWLVFETRDPARRAWEGWTKDRTRRQVTIPAGGVVDTWVEVTSVGLPYVSFRHTYRFEADGAELTSDSTLRFRQRDEIAESVERAGLRVREVRDAPDRPGLELVFLAQRP